MSTKPEAIPAQLQKSQAKEPEASGGLCAIAPHAVQVGEPTRIGAVVGDQVAEEPSSVSPQDSLPVLKPAAGNLTVECPLCHQHVSETRCGAGNYKDCYHYTVSTFRHSQEATAGKLDPELARKMLGAMSYEQEIAVLKHDIGRHLDITSEQATEIERLTILVERTPMVELAFGYTNFRGENSMRRTRPISIRYGKSKYHPREGWLMRAVDLDKGEEREFAMRDMILVDPDAVLFLSVTSDKST